MGTEVLTLSTGLCWQMLLCHHLSPVYTLRREVRLVKSCLRVNDPDETSSLASGPGEEKCTVTSFLNRVKT